MRSGSSIQLRGIRVALWPILIGSLYYLLAAVSLFLTRGGEGIATIWSPSGLMLAVLLSFSRASAPRYVAAGAIGSLLANLTMGVPAILAVGFTVANMTESVLAAWLLQRRAGCRLSFIDPAGIRCFCMASAIAAGVSAALATSVSPIPTIDFYLSWFATDLLGMLIVAPIIIIGVELYRHSDDGLSVRGWPEVVAVLGAVGVVSAAVFAQTSYPLLFLPMAGVLVAVFRLGPLGAAASVLTIALASSISISLGRGPTALIDASPARIFFLQFYLLVLLAAALPVAALLATRDRLLAQLVASNRLLDEARQTAEHNASTATCAAETDELTGLPNRRKAMQVLEAAAAGPGAETLSIAIFDIDHFKRVNDTYGHPVGDKVLRRVARDAAHALRGADFIGRFGGEEFILILPRTSVDHALAVAERVRAAVAGGGLASDTDPSVTVSLGVAATLSDEPAEKLLKRADLALYQAKDAGRNAFRLAA